MQWNLKPLKTKRSHTLWSRTSFWYMTSELSLFSLQLLSLSPVSLEPFSICFNLTAIMHFAHDFVPVWHSQQGLPDHLTQSCKPSTLAQLSLLLSLLYCSPELPLLYDILYILPTSSLIFLPVRMTFAWDQDYLSIWFSILLASKRVICQLKKKNKTWSMIEWFGENRSIVIKSKALELDSPPPEWAVRKHFSWKEK